MKKKMLSLFTYSLLVIAPIGTALTSSAQERQMGEWGSLSLLIKTFVAKVRPIVKTHQTWSP